MLIREIQTDDLNQLLELYTHLHEKGIPKDSKHLRDTWAAICNNPKIL